MLVTGPAQLGTWQSSTFGPRVWETFSLFREHKPMAKRNNDLAHSSGELSGQFSCGPKDGMVHPASRGRSRKATWGRGLLVWLSRAGHWSLAKLGFRTTDNSFGSRNASGTYGRVKGPTSPFFSEVLAPSTCCGHTGTVGSQPCQGHSIASKWWPLLWAPLHSDLLDIVSSLLGTFASCTCVSVMVDCIFQ